MNFRLVLALTLAFLPLCAAPSFAQGNVAAARAQCIAQGGTWVNDYFGCRPAGPYYGGRGGNNARSSDESSGGGGQVSLRCVFIDSRETSMGVGHGHFWNNFARPTGAPGCPANFTLHYRDPSDSDDHNWEVGPGANGAFVTEGGGAIPVGLTSR